MYGYIERRTFVVILENLKEYLEYDFGYKVFEDPDDKSRAIIKLNAEEHCEINKQEIIVIVYKNEVKFVIYDVLSFESDFEELEVYKYLNTLNILSDYVKFFCDDSYSFSAEQIVFTGDMQVRHAPYLLTTNFKKFIKGVDDALRMTPSIAEENIVDHSKSRYTSTVREAVDILGVSTTIVQEWLNEGFIDSKKVDGKILINTDSMMKFKKRWDSRNDKVKNKTEE